MVQECDSNGKELVSKAAVNFPKFFRGSYKANHPKASPWWTLKAPCNISRHWIIHPSDYLRSSGLVFTFCDSVSCRRHRLLTQWILLEILYVRQFSLHRQWLYTWGQDKCQETVRRCENAYHKPEAPVCYRLQEDFVTG